MKLSDLLPDLDFALGGFNRQMQDALESSGIFAMQKALVTTLHINGENLQLRRAANDAQHPQC